MNVSLIITILVLVVMILIVANEGRDMNTIGQFLCVSIVALTAYLVPSCLSEKCDDDDSSSSSSSSELSRDGKGEAFEVYGQGEKAKPKSALKKPAAKPAKKSAKSTKMTKPAKDSKPELTSAGLIAVSKDGKKVLVAQTKRGMWTFVRGHIDGKKKPEDVVLSEAKENLGLTLKASDLKEKLSRVYSFEVSEESYKRHLEKQEKRGEKPQIHGPGMQHREQVLYIVPMEEKDVKVNTETLKDAKWLTWKDAESHMKQEPVSRQLDILGDAEAWAKKNL